ncbi:MAG: hypothetical protein KGN32_12425 [Burkholderiales bacterium]|nr:hypothetical protein [Burkholderiales bacterium]
MALDIGPMARAYVRLLLSTEFRSTEGRFGSIADQISPLQAQRLWTDSDQRIYKTNSFQVTLNMHTKLLIL